MLQYDFPKYGDRLDWRQGTLSYEDLCSEVDLLHQIERELIPGLDGYVQRLMSLRDYLDFVYINGLKRLDLLDENDDVVVKFLEVTAAFARLPQSASLCCAFPRPKSDR